jgi:LacI family transcriptional regulator
MRVTLRDVADRAGVHPGTASRVLSAGGGGAVSAPTAERVRAAARELGYEPNPIARSLRTSRSQTVGVLVPDITNPLFGPIVRGVEDTLDAAGYVSLVINTDNDPARERRAFATLLARQVDGFVLATAHRHDALVDEAIERSLAVVLLNRTVARDDVCAVVGDQTHGVELAVAHLRALGHTRVAHVAGPQHLSTGAARREAFVAAMRHVGRSPTAGDIVVADSFTEEAGRRAFRALLDAGGEPPTAVVAGNDLIALGCLDVLAERGLECPRDVSIVGFNDIPLMDRVTPAMTTVRLPQYEMGRRAAELLLGRVAGDRQRERPIVLEPRLVVRASTAPPRAAALLPAA